MRQTGLLEHLSNYSTATQSNAENDYELINSVRTHLQLLLNTRQGSVVIADDYGMPDFTNFLSTYPSSIPEMEKLIKQTISKYEPRLKNLQVKFIFDEKTPLLLKFKIIAMLYSKTKNAPVTFESHITPSGKVQLKQ